MEGLSSLITRDLGDMIDASDRGLIFSKRKAISALFPYALVLAQGGDQGMADAVLRAIRASHTRGIMWHRVLPYTTTLFKKPIPPPLNRLVSLFSPYVPWSSIPDDKDMVSRWAAAASEAPHTEDIDQSVVDALMQIASLSHLRPHIPRDAWALLNRRPSLPPYCLGRDEATSNGVVQHIRELGDTEILKSYLLLVWSEWNCPLTFRREEMLLLIVEDFGGIGMQRHREDLIGRLDHVLEQLGLGPEHFEHESMFTIPGALFITPYIRPMLVRAHLKIAKDEYGHLRRALRGEVVEREATNTVARGSPALIVPERIR